MEEENFLALVNAVKANGQYIIGFIFDNAGRMMFGPRTPHEMFTTQEYYDTTTKCIVDANCYDTSGNKYIAYKPVATIQSVIVTAPGKTLAQYDPYLLTQ